MTAQLLGVDYAYGRPRAKHLRAAGFRLACRYLSNDSGKNLDAAERGRLLKAGEDIVLVWESTANRATQGRAAGTADGERAVAEAKALRAPKGMALYAAVDFAAKGTEIHDYFGGFRKVVHAAGYLCGGYGSRTVINYLVREGLVDVAWQTVAWSGGKVSPHADLYQRAETRKIDGVTVDVDVICHPGAYGGWQAALAASNPSRKKHEAKKKRAETHPAPVPKPTKPAKKEPRVKHAAKRHSKALGALIGGIVAWLAAALADRHVTTHEWKALAAVLVPAVVTYWAPTNAEPRAKGTTADRGHFDVVTAAVVALIIVVLLVVLLPVLHR